MPSPLSRGLVIDASPGSTDAATILGTQIQKSTASFCHEITKKRNTIEYALVANNAPASFRKKNDK